RDERALRDVEVLQRVRERDGDRMIWLSGIAVAKLALPIIKTSQWRTGAPACLDRRGRLSSTLIDNVIRPPAIRIRRVHRAPFRSRQKSKSDRKIRAMLVRDRAAER